MKRHLSLLVCLVFAATAAMAQTQSDASAPPPRQAELNTWKSYNIKDEQVSAMFPTHPAMTTSSRYRLKTRQTLTDHMVGAYADGVVYGIYTYDNREPRDSFNDFIARETQGPAWEVAGVRKVNLGRFTGKEYSLSKGSLSWTAQFFAVENRFCKFVATGAPADDAAVKQFFASITLERKAGTEVSDGPGILLSGSPETEVFTGKQVDARMRLVMKPEPSYTEEAKQKQVMGTVILRAVLMSDGSVGNISVKQTLPEGLTERAIDAARKIKFIPAMKDGKFVSMWIQLEYNFNLY